MNDDVDLLRRYAEHRNEHAFAQLVQRHVNLVYSVALRQVNGDAHLAADAVQLVFTDLARKAPSLLGHRVLAAWLFTSARFAAAKLVRGEQRRHAREQEAQLMHTLNDSDDTAAQLDWERVRPVLDEVIGELGESDREAILLRFFEGRDYVSIGEKLHLAHNTARMRVERALDKLRAQLERRGVRSTSAALATVLANQAVLAAPAGLAATVTGAALAGGATLAGGAALAGAAGGAAAAGTTFMSITKLQIGLAGVFAVAGATGYVVQAETNEQLRREIATLRAENASLDALKTENRQLARTIADAADMRRDDAEFVRLQQEAGALKEQLRQLQVGQQRAAQESSTTYDISALDRTPVPRFQARPQFPSDARSAGIGGEVVVDFVVNANGDVQNARAIRSSLKPDVPVVKLAPFTVATDGTPATAPMDPATIAKLQSEFEAAAEQAISKWKFRPGVKGGRDVATHLQVPIVFTVSNK